MKNEIVKVNAADYGLEESKAKEIEALFTPMLAKMTDLEKEYNEVVKLKINKETCKKAKELRGKYVKVRTGTAAIHKDAKAFYLAGGRFVDGWKNAQIFASEGIEVKLLEIEKHQENLEKEKIQKLHDERIDKIKPYMEDDMMIAAGIGRMEEAVWVPYLRSVKDAYNLRKEADKKAEEDRVAKVKAEAEEQERIRQDNIRLQKEAKDREAKADEERKAYEDRLKAEREEKARIQKELETKAEAERKAKADEEARIQADLNKGDADKVIDLIKELTALKTKYVFKSQKNRSMYNVVGQLIDKVIAHIK